MTPLHLVARNGDVELLTEFLLACPESITDANVNGETALHITVIYDRFEELKLLTGWMQKRRNSGGAFTEIRVLNRRDRNGDTALHLAANANNHKVCTFHFFFSLKIHSFNFFELLFYRL